MFREAAADLVRLSEGERGAACPDPERHSVVGVEAEELDQQLRVQVVGSGLGSLLQLDDRVVQELRRHAPRDCLDRLSLPRREVGEPARIAGELRADRILAACLHGPDQRGERVRAAPHHPPPDLLGHDLVRPGDVLGGGVALRHQAFADGADVDQPHAVQRLDSGVDVARDGQV